MTAETSYSRRYGSNTLSQPSSFNTEFVLPVAAIFIFSLFYYLYKFRNAQQHANLVPNESASVMRENNESSTSHQRRSSNNSNLGENSDLGESENSRLREFELSNMKNMENEILKQDNKSDVLGESDSTKLNNSRSHTRVMSVGNASVRSNNEAGGNEEFKRLMKENLRSSTTKVNVLDDKAKNLTNPITIFIMVNGMRKEYKIKLSDNIGSFIQSGLSEFSRDKVITIIMAGRRLDPSKSFGDYTMIQDNSMMHAFMTNQENAANWRNPSSSQSSQSASANNNQTNPNMQSSQAYYRDENISQTDANNTVHLYTIIFHSLVAFVFIMLAIAYKMFPEVFIGQIKILLMIAGGVWLTQFSKCVAKLMVYGRIEYN